MSTQEIIHAWKDSEYFRDLSEEQRAILPDSPVGSIEFTSHLAGKSQHRLEDLFSMPQCHPSIVIECSASNCG